MTKSKDSSPARSRFWNVTFGGIEYSALFPPVTPPARGVEGPGFPGPGRDPMTASTPTGAILVIGASLEAERIVHLVRQLPDAPTILGFLTVDSTTEAEGHSLCDLPVLDTLDNLASYCDQVVGAVPAAENSMDRETVLAALVRAGIPALSMIHPSACLGPGTEIAEGAVIHANVTLDVGVRIGRGAVIGVGASLGVRTRVGDYVEVSQGCVIGSGVRLGERARIGLGARITDGVLIGPDAAVGAGSLVTRDVIGASTVHGNPAEPVARQRHPEVDNA